MMTGFDILAIVGFLIIIFMLAQRADNHERWLRRQELRKEAWRKIEELKND